MAGPISQYDRKIFRNIPQWREKKAFLPTGACPAKRDGQTKATERSEEVQQSWIGLAERLKIVNKHIFEIPM